MTQDSGQFDKYLNPEFPVFSPKGGNSYVGRIAPPTWVAPDGSEADHYGYDIWLNYGLGSEQATFLSRSKMGHADDPVVPLIDKLRAQGRKEAVKQIRAKKRVLVWWLGRGEERDGWKLWSMPWTFDKDLAKRAYDRTTGDVMFIDDPDRGYDVSFDVEGTGLKTKYVSVEIARRPSPIVRDSQRQDELLDFLVQHPLNSVLQIYDADYISRVLAGMDVESLGVDRQEDVDEVPADVDNGEALPEPSGAGANVGRETIDDADVELDAEIADVMGDGF